MQSLCFPEQSLIISVVNYRVHWIAVLVGLPMLVWPA